IAGTDKLSFLSPTEAWFEGLRIHPDYRGHGVSAVLEEYMIEEASHRGAKSIRLLTNVHNLPVHRNTFRNGFANRFIVRYWKWEQSSAPQMAGLGSQITLRPATPKEAPRLYEWWWRTPSSQATDGLLHRNWLFSATSPEEWAGYAEREQLLVSEHLDVESLVLPPPFLLVSDDINESGDAAWTIATLSATADEWGMLARGLVSLAVEK